MRMPCPLGTPLLRASVTASMLTRSPLHMPSLQMYAVPTRQPPCMHARIEGTRQLTHLNRPISPLAAAATCLSLNFLYMAKSCIPQKARARALSSKLEHAVLQDSCSRLSNGQRLKPASWHALARIPSSAE